MLDLYYWPTPNGWKVSIMLEECGLPYTVKPINIGQGDQFEPAFRKISPNGRMPAIVDPDGPGGQPISLFESAAILIYLGDKSGQFLPSDPYRRYKVLEWLMWQMGGIGPMCGQAHHFRQYAPEPIPYAIERYTREVGRLYAVLDTQLADHEFAAGDYSIADMAIFPWIKPYERQGQNLDDFPNLKRWFETLAARPAVQRGLAVLEEERRTPDQGMTEERRSILFGDQQYARR